MAELMCRIFGAEQRSMDSALGDYLMHYEGDRLPCENFIYNEGPLPFWFEIVLLLLWAASNEFAGIISLGPHFSAFVSPSLLLIKCGMGFCNVTLLLQAI